jgi:aspartyl-tRNA(Asn)/glutamyl-tRNA(Gln) amidotransferase subunit A
MEMTTSLLSPNDALPSTIEIAESVRRGEIRAVDVLEECLARLQRLNPAINAFVYIDANQAREAAEAVDRAVSRGEDPGALAGVPFGVKDLEDCAGMPTSQGSLLFKGNPPVTADSPHVRRMRLAGAVPIGKTAAAEFGLDSATHTRAWGTTRNPWNSARTPGGSSGGSAAAVAAGIVPLATASDGGGSIRSPAAFTGLVGLKPSHGRIGAASASDLGTHGAVTTTVADTARFLDVVSGPDDRDRTSLPSPNVRYEEIIEQLEVQGLRAAWSADLGYAAVEPVVAEIARMAAEELVKAARLTWVERPFAPPNPYEAWVTEAAFFALGELEANGVWPHQTDLLSDIIQQIAALAEQLSRADVARARMARAQIEADTAALFADVDVLLTPTVACVAFAAEGPIPTEIAGQDASKSGVEPFTMLANMCWNPAISVPAGFSPDGLPIGLQIMTHRWRDDIVLRLARIWEQAHPWPRVVSLE